MRYLTAAQNAREEGRDCAIEGYWMRADTEWSLQAWRERCRSNEVSAFEHANSALCSPGTTREEFDQLLAEWDSGFDEVANLALGSPAARAAAVTKIAVRANALCSLLGITNILEEGNKIRNLRTCAHLAADVAGDLTVFLADDEAGGTHTGTGGAYAK